LFEARGREGILRDVEE
jgi:hypothetical protein